MQSNRLNEGMQYSKILRHEQSKTALQLLYYKMAEKEFLQCTQTTKFITILSSQHLSQYCHLGPIFASSVMTVSRLIPVDDW